MVLEGAAASTQQQDHLGCGGGQWQGREERGPSLLGAGQHYPLARWQPCVLSQNAGRGAGGNFAAVNVEEAAIANVWALEEVDAALDGGGVLAFPLLLGRKSTDEVLLEIERDQPHQHQRQSSENPHCRPPLGAMPSEMGHGSFAAQPPNQHHLRQQQLQNQNGNGMPDYSVVNQYVTKTASNYCSVGLSFGGVGDESAKTAGGQTGVGSPKSSISSDGSGSELVDNSPAAVWEVDMRRGTSKGRGGGGGSGGGGRKRTLDAADESAGLWQQTVRTSESSARLHDKERSIDGLKQLLSANMELESAAKEEIFKQLLQLLKITSLERDEARDQLQKLLTKTAQPSPLDHSPTHLHPDLLLTGRTKSGSLSQTHNYQPYVSSPVESLFESVSSPALPNKSMADPGKTAMAQQLSLPECISSMPPGLHSGEAELDPASVIIDRLVAKKPLPEKGKLLQAVMEAGPLLQTLLVAGSLPRWRNPPPLRPFQIPTVSVRGRESGFLTQNAILNQNYVVQSPPKAFHHQNPHVASQIFAASPPSSPGLGAFSPRWPMPSTCASSYQVPMGKRQKF